MIEIPLFPLSAVLLPHGRMPLQIFERRYLDLVRDCAKSGTGFGVVWIRRGSEVSRGGEAAPDLGGFGTYARVVDWDRLDNGLLGITVEGGEPFELGATRTVEGGLMVGEVRLLPVPRGEPMRPEWSSLEDVLRSLQSHPHVERLGLRVDREDAWQVGYGLAQLLPLEESVRYSLLGRSDPAELMTELDGILNRLSG